jgi:FG-GAP-like repeat
VEVILNDGMGEFPRPAKYAAGPPTSPGSKPGGLVVRDFDGNGKPDVALTNINRHDVAILLHTGQGKLDGQPNYSYPVGQQPSFLDASDLNGDGKEDLVTANVLTQDLSVLLNQGDGKFSISTPYPLGFEPQAMAIADMDKDVPPSVFVVGSSSSVRLENLGGGVLGVPMKVSKGAYVDSIVTTDLNNDGRADFAGVHQYGHTLFVWLSQADGSVSDPVQYDVVSGTQKLMATDLDGDKWPDIVVSGEEVSVFQSLGDGTLAPVAKYTLPTSSDAIAAMDVDTDGDQDIVVSREFGREVMLLLNNAPTLQYAGSFFSRSFLRDLAAADMNADGRPDLIASGLDETDNAEISIIFTSCQP